MVMRARGAVHVLLNAPATPPHISSFVVSGMAYRGAASHGIVPEVDALPSVFLHHAGARVGRAAPPPSLHARRVLDVEAAEHRAGGGRDAQQLVRAPALVARRLRGAPVIHWSR